PPEVLDVLAWARVLRCGPTATHPEVLAAMAARVETSTTAGETPEMSIDVGPDPAVTSATSDDHALPSDGVRPPAATPSPAAEARGATPLEDRPPDATVSEGEDDALEREALVVHTRYAGLSILCRVLEDRGIESAA